MKVIFSKWGPLVLSIGLYLASLSMTAVQGWSGYEVLLFGWASMFAISPANWTWLANIFLFFAWIGMLSSHRRIAIRFSVLAVLLAGMFLLCRNVIVGEDGVPHPIVSYYSGYWLWLSSTILALCGALRVKPKQAEQAAPEDAFKATRL